MKTSTGEKALNYVVLATFAIFALAPVVTILITAFSPQTGDAPGIHLENLAEAWTVGGFGRSMLNSLIVAALVVPIGVVLSLLTGYAFGTMTFRGSRVLFMMFLLGLMIPGEAVVIPLFFDLRTLGLTDTYAAIVLPQIAHAVAFGTFWLRAQFRALPDNLLEAAALDGAGPLQALTRVMAPAALPGVVTLVVLLFMWTWNEFLVALVMAPSGQLRTAPLGLASFQGQYTSEVALLAAGAVIVAMPIIVLFIFLQRHFVRGMLEGATKG